jgi:hypothetical protein
MRPSSVLSTFTLVVAALAVAHGQQVNLGNLGMKLFSDSVTL